MENMEKFSREISVCLTRISLNIEPNHRTFISMMDVNQLLRKIGELIIDQANNLLSRATSGEKVGDRIKLISNCSTALSECVELANRLRKDRYDMLAYLSLTLKIPVLKASLEAYSGIVTEVNG